MKDGALDQARILDISQDAIFLWRDPGGIELWNNGAAELYGYSAKHTIGRSPHELLGTKFPQPLAKIRDLLRRHGFWEGELLQRTRDRRELIIWARMKVVSKSGSGLLILESARDITEGRRSQEALERRLREEAVLAQFSLDALRAAGIQTICDDATHILARELGGDFSALFELIDDGRMLLLRSGFGYPAGLVGTAQIKVNEETAIGRALQLNRSIVISDWREDKRLRLPEFLRDQKVVSSVAVVIQGRERAFGGLAISSKIARVFDENEVHFMESLGNILATAISRIQFEQRLGDTAARIKAIVDTAVDGIITIDEQGVVETMNPAAERIFGYTATEVVGHNVSMLMPEPYRSEHDSYIERYHRTGERRIIGIGREVRGRRKDGSEFPMDLAVSVTNLGDRRIFTGLVRDITARKRLEQELLEISDREQRRIGSDLHDDLCQRLAGIRFACDVVKKRLSQSMPGEMADRIAKIGADVGDAIDRTRMLARGLAPVALENNGLASALKELTRSVQKLFTVSCTFRINELVSVTDPLAATHLYRIVQEALNNALKHGNPSAITVSLEMRDHKAVLSIEDNGVGFSMAEVHATNQGMGLRTIAYRAAMIDAGLQVQSEPGKGTKVICTFSPDL